MISYLKAIEFISQNQRRNLDSVEVFLNQACGRVIAQDYFCDHSIPEFGNSAMDGFAVVAEQTQTASHQNPVRLKVLGTLVAGDRILESSTFHAWEVMTGAPIPIGLNSVVKIEDVKVLRHLSGEVIQIELNTPVLNGQFYRPAGSDFKKGTCIVKRGTLITAEHILIFAALGLEKIQVLRKPRVIIISTGQELAVIGQQIQPGQIYNATAPFLEVMLAQMGVEASFFHASDDPQVFMKLMNCILQEQPDIVITTGGVSMGKHDFVKTALMDLGAQIEFHRIAMRPGKPNLFAQFNKGPVVFGLPGNPISTVVGLRFLVEPFLRTFMGRSLELPLRIQLDTKMNTPHELCCFLKSKLIHHPMGGRTVRVLQGQESYMLHSLLEADAWIRIPEKSSEKLEENPDNTTDDTIDGSWVDVFPLSVSMRDENKQLPKGDVGRGEECCS